MPPDGPLDRLHRDLGLKRLNPLWAKLEIVFGLAAAGGGLLLGMRLVHVPEWDAAGSASALTLFVLGGYLAMAGHRSHLYQSSNRLAAYLADLTRRPTDRTP